MDPIINHVISRSNRTPSSAAREVGRRRRPTRPRNRGLARLLRRPASVGSHPEAGRSDRVA